MTLVCSYPRIHVCLFDLAGATGRKHGGAGFTLDGLPTRIVASRSGETRVLVDGDNGTFGAEIEAALLRISTCVRQSLIADIRVSPGPNPHLGLGSKTAIMLGVLEALKRLFALALTDADIQKLSGRGGTSGIGVNSFFTGGFIIDGGHPQDHSQIFEPSSFRSEFPIPPIMFRTAIPETWRFHLCDVSGGLRMFGADEVAFFRANTPVPAAEVFESIAIAYHALAPAVRNSDLDLFRSGIARISELGFKKREISGQSDDVRTLITALRSYDSCAVGMSSMGPLVYAIAEADNPAFTDYLLSLSRYIRFDYLGAFAGRNRGFGSIID